MGHALVGFTTSDICHPFPEDGSVDEGLTPEGVCDARIAGAEVAQVVMGDEPALSG
jgi:hypothetical protein